MSADYLQKYLSASADGHKRKKKKAVGIIRSNVIIHDDDADWANKGGDIEEEEGMHMINPFAVAEQNDEDDEDQFALGPGFKPVGAKSSIQIGNLDDAEPERSGEPVSFKRRKRHDSPEHGVTRRVRHDSPDADAPKRKVRHDSPDMDVPRRARHDSPDMDVQRRPARHDSPDLDVPRRAARQDSPDMDVPRRRTGNNTSHDLSPPRASASHTAATTRVPVAAEISLGTGLIPASELKKQTQAKAAIEAQMLARLSASDSGLHAETVHRDKSGRVLEPKLERLKKRQEEQAKAEKEEQQMAWGRGVVQLEQRDQMIRDEIHERAKPLARHVDDADLNRLQKEQLHVEDPMMAFLTNRREKQAEKAGKPVKPKYRGPPPPPNRFNIPPGYRWDGVDRSNGFEKRWFDSQAKKKVYAELDYKYRVEDL